MYVGKLLAKILCLHEMHKKDDNDIIYKINPHTDA